MNRREFFLYTGAAASLGLLSRSSAFGQTPVAAPAPIKPTVPVQMPAPVTEFRALRRNVGIFTGRGGTIGWLSSPDALAIVDTQFPETAAICLAGLPGRGGRMIDVVIDTHHHGDHTGGNGTFKPAAKMIAAQKNVPPLQLAAFERTKQEIERRDRENHAATPTPMPSAPTYPDFLFGDSWRKELGDEVMSAKYFGPSHTGGDVAVYFERANVVHVGDLLFNRLYPVTDRPGGCNLRHWITAMEDIAKTYPQDALYVFGHGKKEFGVTGAQADLFVFRDFLTALVEHTEKEIKAGKSRAEIIKLTNLPGWPDYFADDKTSRLPGNLGAAYDELTGA